MSSWDLSRTQQYKDSQVGEGHSVVSYCTVKGQPVAVGEGHVGIRLAVNNGE